MSLTTLEEGRYLEANQAFLDGLGFTREEVLGRTHLELATWEEPALRAEVIRRLTAGQTVEGITTARRHKSGHSIRVLYSGAILEVDGRPCLLSLAQDLTALERAQSAARASASQYRRIVDTAIEGIWATNANQRITFVNREMARLLACRPEEMLGAPVTDFLFPEDIPDHRVKLHLRQQGRTQRYERRFRRKDGAEVWVIVSVSPLMDPAGRFQGAFALFTDISDRKRMEDELRVSRDRLRRTQSLARVGSWEIDLGRREMWASEEGFRVYGLEPTPDGVLPLAEAQRVPRAEDRPRLDRALAELLAGQAPYDVEFHVRRISDGELRVVHSQAELLRDRTGRPCKVVGAIQDVTDLRKSERKIESLAKFPSENPHPVWRLSPDGSLLYANSATLNLLAESGPGGVMPAEWLELSRLAWREGRVMPREAVMGKRAFSFFFVPCPDHGYVNCYGQDITERRRAEAEKARLESQLAQAQKMEAIGTLAGGIAHDFNNILGAIMGYAELAQERTEDGEGNREELGLVIKAAERARGLVRQILTFSRKMEADQRPMDLNQAASRALEILGRTLPRMVDIVVHLAPDLAPINADAGQMEQIFLNLATNAADAMPDGGELTIETGNVELSEDYCRQHLDVRPGRYVLLAVSDTGCGMAPETVKHIFEPFFTTKEVGKGTGLGLSTVYGIVKSHGGQISCYSEPGLGTTFRIYLPVHQLESDVSRPETVGPEAILGGSETILLVDDEESLRTLGALTLRKAGYRVTTAASGEEALALHAGQGAELDLVVLDLGMPGMGGHRCLKELLARDPKLRVVIASGYSANGQVRASLESGALGYVAKPFRRIDLLATVRQVLDRR